MYICIYTYIYIYYIYYMRSRLRAGETGLSVGLNTILA